MGLSCTWQSERLSYLQYVLNNAATVNTTQGLNASFWMRIEHFWIEQLHLFKTYQFSTELYQSHKLNKYHINFNTLVLILSRYDCIL